MKKKSDGIVFFIGVMALLAILFWTASFRMFTPISAWIYQTFDIKMLAIAVTAFGLFITAYAVYDSRRKNGELMQKTAHSEEVQVKLIEAAAEYAITRAQARAQNLNEPDLDLMADSFGLAYKKMRTLLDIQEVK